MNNVEYRNVCFVMVFVGFFVCLLVTTVLTIQDPQIEYEEFVLDEEWGVSKMQVCFFKFEISFVCKQVTQDDV